MRQLLDRPSVLLSTEADGCPCDQVVTANLLQATGVSVGSVPAMSRVVKGRSDYGGEDGRRCQPVAGGSWAGQGLSLAYVPWAAWT